MTEQAYELAHRGPECACKQSPHRYWCPVAEAEDDLVMREQEEFEAKRTNKARAAQ